MKQWISKILFSIAISVAVTAANANSFEGLYLGLNLGAMETIASISQQTTGLFTDGFSTAADPDSISLSNQSDSKQKFFAAGGIYLGYGRMISSSVLYLGADIFGDLAQRTVYSTTTSSSFSPASDDVFTVNLTTETKVRLSSGEVGLDLKPGFLLTPTTLIYGRVGAAFNNLRLSSYSTMSNNQLLSSLQATTDKRITGLRLGLGAEEHLGNRWSLTVDYIFTDYGSINLNSVGPTISPTDSTGSVNVVIPNGFTNQTNANLHTQTLTIGLKYYFYNL